MKNELVNNQLKNLYRAFLTLKSEEECENFLHDLTTHAERVAMAQRLEVALLLNKKTVYSEIAKKTGASSATICRVNNYLNAGAGGYKTVIDRLLKDGE